LVDSQELDDRLCSKKLPRSNKGNPKKLWQGTVFPFGAKVRILELFAQASGFEVEDARGVCFWESEECDELD
jgi:hypothetical protein